MVQPPSGTVYRRGFEFTVAGLEVIDLDQQETEETGGEVEPRVCGFELTTDLDVCNATPTVGAPMPTAVSLQWNEPGPDSVTSLRGNLEVWEMPSLASSSDRPPPDGTGVVDRAVSERCARGGQVERDVLTGFVIGAEYGGENALAHECGGAGQEFAGETTIALEERDGATHAERDHRTVSGLMPWDVTLRSVVPFPAQIGSRRSDDGAGAAVPPRPGSDRRGAGVR